MHAWRNWEDLRVLPLYLACALPYCSLFSFLFSLGDPSTEIVVCQSGSFGALPPSLPYCICFLHGLVWSGASLAATVAAVGPALPQFSIKTPNLNGAFKPRPAPLRPLPLIPPCSDSAFFFDFLAASKCNGPLQDEISYSRVWRIKPAQEIRLTLFVW